MLGSYQKKMNKQLPILMISGQNDPFGEYGRGVKSLARKFKKAGISDVNVTNTAINQLPNDAQLVITQKKLTDRAIKQTPNAIHISVDNFLNSPRYEELLNNLKKDDQA